MVSKKNITFFMGSSNRPFFHFEFYLFFHRQVQVTSTDTISNQSATASIFRKILVDLFLPAHSLTKMLEYGKN